MKRVKVFFMDWATLYENSYDLKRVKVLYGGLNRIVGKFIQFERCGLNQVVGKFLRFEKSERFDLTKL